MADFPRVTDQAVIGYIAASGVDVDLIRWNIARICVAGSAGAKEVTWQGVKYRISKGRVVSCVKEGNERGAT